MSAKLLIRKEPHPQPLPACGEVSSKRSFSGVGFQVCIIKKGSLNEKNLSAMHENMVAPTRSSTDFKVPT